MTVRACFRVIDKGEDNDHDRLITMVAVADENEEYKKFFEATPWGELDMSVLNKDAYDQFEIDQEYYVDFTPVSRT